MHVRRGHTAGWVAGRQESANGFPEIEQVTLTLAMPIGDADSAMV